METRSVSDAAFEALVERYSAEIYAYLWRLLRDPEQASDCLQDTYLRALRAFPRLQHRDHLRAWLYTIGTHRARTLQREAARRNRRQEDLKDEIADPRPSVGKRVADRETLRRVLQAVDRLPEKQRQALILRRYQGLAYADIAAVLGGSPAAARTNVHLAQERLKGWLQADGVESRTARRRGKV
jgi:RNA polymerase sigma-70 factor (ECF subfamily)